MMLCTFFGHRDCPDSIKQKLRVVVESLIRDKGIKKFMVGNHGNFDRLVRDVLKEYKQIYDIHYEIVLAGLPSSKSRSCFYDEEHYITPDNFEAVPKRYSIDFRNRFMLKHADCIVAYITHDFGTGAAKYIGIAKKRKIPIINIAKM